jgi:hypothetical protein
LLVLDPMELPFVASNGMKELPLEQTTEAELLGQSSAKAWEAKVEWATESVDLGVRAASYRVGRVYCLPPAREAHPCSQAWLGFYKTSMRLLGIRDDLDIVRAANAYSEEVLRYGRQNDLPSLPPFERKVLGKLGLSHEAQRRVNKAASPAKRMTGPQIVRGT